jgi:N-acetyl-anhydromuramyl-L-alanine amidase AmpD
MVMKVKKIIPLLLIISFVLGGCGKAQEPVNATTMPTTAEETTIPYYLQDVYSPMAEPDFLDFEKSSWAREYKPEFVMIHFTSAVTLDRENPYDKEKNRKIFEDYEIGINYIIDREGNITCYLPENRAAWHAGAGEWNDDPKYTNLMNKYSIGIEVLAIGSKSDMEQYLSSYEYNSLDDSLIGYTDAQYTSLKALVEDICNRQNITLDREHVIGHEEYSERKSDPGELFDWSRVVPGA